MDMYNTYQANGTYDNHSGYCGPRILAYPESKCILDQVRDKSLEFMEQDAATLAELLTPVYLEEDATLAEQVFGNQTKHQRLSLAHVVNLLNERVKLHKRHMHDIAHCNMHVQEALFGAHLQRSLDNGRRETRIEGMLVQLDQQKRQEELGFWKDTAELRDRLFDQAREYQSLRHRTGLMKSVETGGDVYG